MRRVLLSIIIAVVGIASFGVLSPSAPAAHAQVYAPTLTAVPNVVRLGDTANVNAQYFTPNNQAYVYFQRPDGTSGALYLPTGPYGSFTFNLGFLALHGTGIEFVGAYDYGSGRWTPTVSITVAPGVPVIVRQLNVSSQNPVVGTSIVVSGTGFSANNFVYVSFQRPDGTTGAYWAPTDAWGSFVSELGFTAAHGCGTESIWAYDNLTGQWIGPRNVTVTGCGAQPYFGPTNLRAIAVTRGLGAPLQTTVSLQWDDNTTGEMGFRIHATLTHLYGGTDTLVQQTGPNYTYAAVSFPSGGINPVKTACFTVTAFSGGYESQPSNQACVNIP